MIDFVAYFSTAQDRLGYIVLEGHGTSVADLAGGPPLAHGIYRVESGALVQVQAEPIEGKTESESYLVRPSTTSLTKL